MQFLLIGAVFIGLGFFIKAFPYFGSYTIDELINGDVENNARSMGYVLIVMGAIIAVFVTVFELLGWYRAVSYTMFGCMTGMFISLFVIRLIHTIKKKE